MHNQILQLLKTEQNIIVKNEDENYQIISNTKDGDGDYRCSSWRSTIEEAKESIGNNYGYSPEHLEKEAKNWELVDTFPNETEPYKPNQKVRVLPQAKEIMEKCGYWDDNMEEHLGQVGEIAWFGTSYYRVKFDDGENCYFTHDCLSAFIPEAVKETAEDEILITPEMVGRMMRVT